MSLSLIFSPVGQVPVSRLAVTVRPVLVVVAPMSSRTVS